MIGRIIGPYEVIASIGKGGMGEVYKARDQKLGREVALKILPPEFAKDKDRLVRFQREARVLASLQHQNIAAIYGLEEVDGQPVLAMELADGEDLSERLLRGVLPANEIDKITCQLARGLEYAHDKGIVHRDLKPANIKVSGDGTVKILDFGLARAFSADGSVVDDSESQSYQPTITQALTSSGTVLGTAAYMSPEQARGYEVDRRADIWSFGVIVHEMMTGERLFEGETATDTLAAVLHKEPQWEDLESRHSAVLVQLCRRCLVKEANQRLRDIGEARLALEGSGSSISHLGAAPLHSSGVTTTASKSGRRQWILTTALALSLIAMMYLNWSGRLDPNTEPWPLVRSDVSVPVGLTHSLNPMSPGPAQVSPDGRHLCFVASDSTGTDRVYVRNLANGQTRELRGSENARYPFWSYDSREVGFVGSQLVRMPINGGPAISIASAPNGKGGSWNQFDQVLFTPTHSAPIMMVPAAGGDPVEVTSLANDTLVRSHRLPQWLPDGKHFQYTAVTTVDEVTNLDCIIRVVEAATGKSVDLMRAQSSVTICAEHVFYPHDGVLMARPLDMKTFTFTGPAFPILSDVLTIREAHYSAFSASASGVLAYSNQSDMDGASQMVHFGPDGQEIGLMGQPLRILAMNFSPDGHTLVMGIPHSRTGTFDLALYDIDRNIPTRLTFDTESEWGGLFSPDGTWVAMYSDHKGRAGAYRFPVSGGDELEPILLNGATIYPTSFSLDGQTLYASMLDSTGFSYLGEIDVESGVGSRVHPKVRHSENWPVVSPDGRMLAYESSATGDSEIFIESLIDSSKRWRVSVSGGRYPVWGPGGDVFYFFDTLSRMVRLTVEDDDGDLRFGEPEVIIEGLSMDIYAPYVINPVTGDIVGTRPVSGREAGVVHLVTGWERLLEQGRQ